LSLGLSFILIFIGIKLILLYGHEVNAAIPKIPTSLSLAIIAAILTIATVASFIKVRKDPTARAHAGRITGASKDHEH
jgi:tellurite resistance protein TerC